VRATFTAMAVNWLGLAKESGTSEGQARVNPEACTFKLTMSHPNFKSCARSSSLSRLDRNDKFNNAAIGAMSWRAVPASKIVLFVCEQTHTYLALLVSTYGKVSVKRLAARHPHHLSMLAHIRRRKWQSTP
jgi:hypothetical protein